MSTLPDTASDALFARVAAILEQARARAVRAVHNEMVLAYWHIGREIVTDLQQGAARAGYGDALLAGLSARLSGRFGKGYSETNLKYFRQFYVVYADRTPEIRHEPRDESAGLLPGPTGEPDAANATLALAIERVHASRGFLPELSWTHYRCHRHPEGDPLSPAEVIHPLLCITRTFGAALAAPSVHVIPSRSR